MPSSSINITGAIIAKAGSWNYNSSLDLWPTGLYQPLPVTRCPFNCFSWRMSFAFLAVREFTVVPVLSRRMSVSLCCASVACHCIAASGTAWDMLFFVSYVSTCKRSQDLKNIHQHGRRWIGHTGLAVMCSWAKPCFSVRRRSQGVLRACLGRVLGLCRYAGITVLASLAIRLLNLFPWLEMSFVLVFLSLNPILRNTLPRFCGFCCWCFIKS